MYKGNTKMKLQDGKSITITPIVLNNE